MVDYSGWGKCTIIMGNTDTQAAAERVEPVFFLSSDVEQEDGNYLTVFEVCSAASEIVTGGSGGVDGAQRIGGLWRIYLKNRPDRIFLLSSGINLRGLHITLHDKNPFSLPSGVNVESTRLYIRNVPLSCDNEVIINGLKSLGVVMLGSLKYARARTPQGQLTNFKTGDRFVEIVVPPEPLPKKLDIGVFNATLYHKEQKQRIEDIECGNCKQKGHTRKNCENDPVCYDCLESGHKRGSPLCTAFGGAGFIGGQIDDELNEEVNEGGKDKGEDDYDSDQDDKSEIEENSDNGEGENGEKDETKNDEEAVVAQEQLENAAKTPTAAKKPNVQAKPEAKPIPQKLWSAAAQSTPLRRVLSPARSRKLDERSPEMGSESKNQSKKTKK